MTTLKTMEPKRINNLDTLEGKFYRNLGDGKKAAVALQDMILSVVTSRDTTVLTRAIHRAQENKDDTQAATTVRIVVKAVWPEATLSKDGNGHPVIKIAGVKADDDAVKRLHEAVEKNLSIRNAAFRKLVVGAVKEDKPFDPKVTAERFVKKHKLTEVRALIAALQVQEKELAATAAAEAQLKDVTPKG